MLPSILVTVLAAAPSSGGEVNVRQTRDAAIVVLTPFGGVLRTDASTIITAASDALRRDTDLRLVPAGQLGIDAARIMACPNDGRIECWRLVAGEAPVVALVIVTLAPGDDDDRIAIWMIDLATGASVSVDPVSAADPSARFLAAVEGPLRRLLESIDAFRPYGNVAIETDCDGCVVDVPGVGRFPVQVGTTHLRGLRAGDVQLGLFRGTDAVCARQVTVARGGDERIVCSVPPVSDDSAGHLVMWGAGATAAVGAGLIAWSGALAAGGPERVCVGDDPDRCNFGGTARSGFGIDASVAPGDETNGGVPLVALGAGAVGAGVTAFTVAWLWDDAPWWAPVLTGLVSGVGTAAVVGVIDR